MNVDAIVAAITSGTLDADLERVEKAVEARQRFNSERTLLSLRPGDRVRIGDTVSPRYLARREATVVSLGARSRRGQQAVIVDFDTRIGRFHKNVTVTSGLIGGKVGDGQA